ncbi:MAG: hypothetical protein IPP88_14065 [Betaproteobacteria bacterium]|nr:hypothetical protein [Betaproteobacteria bacterium]
MPAPVVVTSLLLAPGERAEILLDLRGDAGKSIRFVSAAFALSGGMMGGGMMGTAPPQGSAFDVMTFVVSTAAPPVRHDPECLSDIVRPDPAAAITSHIRTDRNGWHERRPASHQWSWSAIARIDFVARRGDLERWHL